MLLALAAAATLTNPILPGGPDPFILTDGGWFYFMATRGDRLAIRRTRDLSKLAEAAEHVVWRAPASGPNSVSIWAPELHRIAGKWYIYYSAAERGHDDDAHRGIFVLENASADPLRGTWLDRGRIATRFTGIDGTVFAAQGRRWFAYSAYDGGDSVLALAPLATPWTLAAPEVVIARPDAAWERQGGRQILEGPAFLQGPRGDLFLTYSGSACWSDEYAIGQLRAAPGANLMDPASWTKAAAPVLAKAPQNDVYATGHHAFFGADHGRHTWIVYHANTGAGQGCTGKRSPRVQRITWSRNGQPVYSVPAHAGVPVVAPRP